jgi:GDSL-like lipase/acylhydrolase family protein
MGPKLGTSPPNAASSAAVTRRTVVGLLLAGAVVIAAVGFGVADRASTGDPAPSTTQAPRGGLGSIALIGDSLSAQSTVQQIASLKEAGWGPVVVNALSGRRIPSDSPDPPSSGIAALHTVRAAGNHPTTWIVELGTNDVIKNGADAVELRRVIELMLDAIGPGHRIVWVNVHTGYNPKGAVRFNAVLRAVAAGRRDLTIADWAGHAKDGNFLLADDTHLTVAGTEAFASLITRTATRAAS